MPYLDHNAGSPLRAGAAEAVEQAVAAGLANPSSVHGPGRHARAAIEQSREQTAALLGAPSDQVFFTSGGTEANNLALLGPLKGGAYKRLIISAVEHPSVAEMARELGRISGSAPKVVGVDKNGAPDLDRLRELLKGPPALVSFMAANNETGVVFPVVEIAEIARAAGALVHCDAVQAAGKMSLTPLANACDIVTISGHKLGALSGVGAIYIADSVNARPTHLGGGQEQGVRPGTENLLGIISMGAAAAQAAAAWESETGAYLTLRWRLEKELRRIAPEAEIVAADSPRTPNTTLVLLPGREAQSLVPALDLEGLAVSAGAACHSGKVHASKVLLAMGYTPEESKSSLRFSLGHDTTQADVDQAVRILDRVLARG